MHASELDIGSRKKKLSISKLIAAIKHMRTFTHAHAHTHSRTHPHAHPHTQSHTHTWTKRWKREEHFKTAKVVFSIQKWKVNYFFIVAFLKKGKLLSKDFGSRKNNRSSSLVWKKPLVLLLLFRRREKLFEPDFLRWFFRSPKFRAFVTWDNARFEKYFVNSRDSHNYYVLLDATKLCLQ